jgi:F-type H+-transporting ATPase subunit b
VVQTESIAGVLAEGPTETPTAGHTETPAAGEHTTAETVQPDNPVLPVVAELAWSTAMFVLLWALLKFWLLKPIVKTMEERAERIRRELDLAERLKADAATALSEHEAGLVATRAEASRIIDEARAEAEEERRRILAAAEAEVAERRAQANAEVARAKTTALESMRSTVASIAVQAAGLVVQKPLDEARQRAIVDEYLDRASRN